MTEIKKLSAPLSRADWGIAALAWLLAFGLYVRTLAPSLLWDDPAEIQTLAYTLGMTHGSGYVSYIFIANLFTKIPIGNIAYRVNLASGFFGALAVAQIFVIARLLGSRRPAAFAASVLLATMERFWTLSIIAELYAPSAAFIAAIWLLLLLWRRSNNWIFLFAAGILGGLSLGIHSSILLTGVSVALFMAFNARSKSAWLAAVAGAVLGAALAFSAFLYLDEHDPPSSVYNTVYRPALDVIDATPETFDTALERLAAIAPDNSLTSYYFTAAADVTLTRLRESLTLFPFWAVILIVIGAVALFWRACWHDGLYPLVSFLLLWGLAVTISLSSYRDFYIPAAVMAVVWFGVGASLLLDAVEKFAQPLFPGALILSALALILLPLIHVRAEILPAVAKGRPDFVRREHVYPAFAPDKAIDDARKILKRIEPNAIVFTDWDRLYSMIYTAELVVNRKDVIFHEADMLETRRVSAGLAQYIEANLDSRPIYFMVMLKNLSELYRVEQVDEALLRIYRK